MRTTEAMLAHLAFLWVLFAEFSLCLAAKFSLEVHQIRIYLHNSIYTVCSVWQVPCDR